MLHVNDPSKNSNLKYHVGSTCGITHLKPSTHPSKLKDHLPLEKDEI